MHAILQIIFEILRNLGNQVGAVHAIHIVVMTRINEVIQLFSIVDAVFNEHEAVLPHHDRVGSAMNQEQLAFELVGFVFKTRQLVAFGIFFRCVHVTFAVHDFIVFPVHDGTACHRHLESFRMIDFQRCGHEAAVTPSVGTNAVGIDIRKGFQVGDARHLVAHFKLSALAVYALLESLAAVGRATVVKREDDKTFLSKVVQIDTGASHP